MIFIPDIYQINFGGQQQDSEQYSNDDRPTLVNPTTAVDAVFGERMAELTKTQDQKWVWYSIFAAGAAISLTVIGSQSSGRAAIPMVFFCPPMALLLALAAPLRNATRHRAIVAMVYLAIGLTTTVAAWSHMQTPPPATFSVIVASIGLQTGLACTLGAMLKLATTIANSLGANDEEFAA